MGIKSILVKSSMILGAILISGASLALPVSAETLAQSKIDQFIQNRCDRITNLIDARIQSYNDNKDSHIKRYDNIKTVVEDLINKLSAKGYDVSEVKTNLQTLNDMVKTFGSDYSTFIDDLSTAKTYACGNSSGEFKSAVDNALVELKAFRDQGKSIVNFVQNTLKPSIQNLKNQHPSKSTNNG